MGPTNLDMQEKSMVMALVGEGLSNREIGRKLRSESVVRRIKKAAAVLGTGAVPERKKGTGRKRKTHPRTDKLLEREVKKDSFITAKELKEAHADVLGEVSVRTIQDHLQKHLKLPLEHILSLYPFAEISILGDFNVQQQLWLSSPFTDHRGELAFKFTILYDLEQLVQHPTHIPDCHGDTPNFLIFF
ncbi:hypothetical protein E2C01_026893 [Portunus trituberculatus]|uniref:Uncharacterized protein n=1 Tax=Portunus trituberculatus TaxID=210409 RepID=A0A5B7EK74_PORTR|nr:hypothetical protein [Portunus trituberculatus]